ncbi:GAF domain-containing sensor histidine kinase [Gephyromycinifex aptenodytis]|uniref:GAF domain-containing sensor histidine kinase n=1 Tax=Gephyromycinifex aptenodytis TaxID=2716227 RepID=UPI001D023AEE|nr:GAF domain-containing sensor histidine kinase [Gephyromycinifex aptenodytis]
MSQPEQNGLPARSDDRGGAGQLTPQLPRPSALDLEDLLGEIRRRTQGARDSQERLGALLDAVVAISSNLDLSVVLAHVVESACTLLGAQYGALGVVDPGGQQLAEFITHGMDKETVESLGSPPHGLGVLGLLLTEPRPRRIDDLREHPDAVGFPPGHPEMSSFIGAPVRVRDQVFGNLYLTEKRGGGTFTEDDEAVLTALAAAAGIAVDNAQLYRRARRSQQWAQAVGELTQTLLEGRNERSAIARMVKRARDLADAQLSVFLVRDPEGGLLAQAVDVQHAQSAELLGSVLHDRRWELLLSSRTPVLLVTSPDDLHRGELTVQLRERAGLDPYGTTSIVPLTVGEVELGLIALSWGLEAPSEMLESVELLSSFADRMGLAVEAARAQRQRSRAVLLEDRDRIARDMHDHVIQRLFAAGLSLQAVTRQLDGPLRDRVEGAVDDLDAAIKDIRSAIFELHHGFPEGGLGPELEAVVERATAAFGFVPDVTFEGLLGDVPAELEPDVVAVVREGLSNVARHAHATDAQVRVSTVDDLVITVRDNGVGVRADAACSGLANLDERARSHGGSFDVQSLDPGTQIRWSVPLTGQDVLGVSAPQACGIPAGGGSIKSPAQLASPLARARSSSGAAEE